MVTWAIAALLAQREQSDLGRERVVETTAATVVGHTPDPRAVTEATSVSSRARPGLRAWVR